jgi:hypothetical protein
MEEFLASCRHQEMIHQQELLRAEIARQGFQAHLDRTTANQSGPSWPGPVWGGPGLSDADLKEMAAVADQLAAGVGQALEALGSLFVDLGVLLVRAWKRVFLGRGAR